jgi:hypothetical protein
MNQYEKREKEHGMEAIKTLKDFGYTLSGVETVNGKTVYRYQSPVRTETKGCLDSFLPVFDRIAAEEKAKKDGRHD